MNYSDAAIAVFSKQLQDGYLPQNIIGKGHSFGAAVLTCAVYYFAKRNIFLFLWNSRSLTNIVRYSLSKICEYLVRKHLVNDSAISRAFVDMLLGIPLYMLAILSGWDFKAGHAYSEVDHRRKFHYAFEEDKVIPDEASIHVDQRYNRELSNLYYERSLKVNKRASSAHLTRLKESYPPKSKKQPLGHYRKSCKLVRKSDSADSQLTAQEMFKDFVNNRLALFPELQSTSARRNSAHKDDKPLSPNLCGDCSLRDPLNSIKLIDARA